ncbi:MAG: quinone oxidoreductase family protein [Bacillota bacterium]
MKAIRLHQYGGPEVLQCDEIPIPEPGPGQVRVKFEAIGVNFHDTYTRSGLYQVTLPHTTGIEGAGVVDAVGPSVTEVKVGDRVAHGLAGATGGEYGLADVAKLVPVPAAVSAETAAAVMIQGLTAHYLAGDTFPVQPGHRVLIHAAAGGTGRLLVQIAKRRGATVYGTVGSPEKAELARAAGADEVILYNQTDFVAEVQRLTNGQGVDAVYDSVGQDTFMGSLRSLAPRGMLVSFGQSSGAVAPLPPLALITGSYYLTRPHLKDYTRTREELLRRSTELFEWIAAGQLDVRIDSRYPLTEAAEAHRRLESRRATGKILLLP